MGRYQGGKNGAGVFQTIINHIPAHQRYIEAFAGSAAIYRHKAPAPGGSILIEAHAPQAAKLRADLASSETMVLQGDALQLLPCMNLGAGAFVYLDPPYHPAARRDLNLYECELTADQHHQLLHSLLPAIAAAGAQWALSGYRCAAYDDAAQRHGWHRIDYTAQTRRGPATESLWLSFDPATVDHLHDYRYVGGNFRERERISRKLARWVRRLQDLPLREQQAIYRALASTIAAGEGARSIDGENLEARQFQRCAPAATAAAGDGIPPANLARLPAAPPSTAREYF